MLFVGDQSMVEIVAIVEGQTEQTFVRDQLADHLGYQGVTIWAVLPGKNRRTGGVKDWDVASADIIRILKKQRYCTTMFDYYGLPESWPGRGESGDLPWQIRASHVEEAILKDITARMGSNFNPVQFLPYVQLHEFEALLFSDVSVLSTQTKALPGWRPQDIQNQFQRILEEAGDPEAINDNYETCPSRRIEGLVKSYRKALHGPMVTNRIGLQTIGEKCSHFASWLDRLESLSA